MSALLIKNAEVYSPKALGKKDILLINNTIVAIEETITIPAWLDAKTIDASGLKAVPGFIDAHVHITGGGGEAGFSTQVPPVTLSTLIQSGITTVGGLLGTDTVTRSVEALLAKAHSLDEEGISTFIVTGGYPVPSPTITGSVRRDIALIEKVRGAKMAISDHRVAQVSKETVHQMATEVRIGGMLCGFVGMLIVHMGDGKDGLSAIFDTIETSPHLSTHFIVTHINRSENVFEDAIKLGLKNGYIDLTSGINESIGAIKPSKALLRALNAGVDMKNILMSSDGNGSQARYGEDGSVVGLSAASPISIHSEFVDLVNDGMEISQALCPITQNVAKAFGLKTKGNIAVDADADLLLLDKDLQISSVIAKGKVLMQDKEIIVKGKFE